MSRLGNSAQKSVPLYALVLGSILVCESSCSLVLKDAIAECENEEDCKQPGLIGASPTETPDASDAAAPDAAEDSSAPQEPNSAAGTGGTSTAALTGSSAGNSAAGAPTQSSDAGNDAKLCTPTQEVCNDQDDDCDGIIDDGCPAAIAWQVDTERKALGDSLGGNYFGDSCANDEVLVGIKAVLEFWIDQVIGICQKIGVKPDKTSIPFQYSMVFGSTRELPAHGLAQETTTRTLLCPAGQAVIGFKISQQKFAASSGEAVVIPKLWITCGELYPVDQLTGGAIKWRNAQEIGPASGSLADNTAWLLSDKAPDTVVAVRLHGTAGSWIDRIGIGTSTLAVTKK